MSNKRKKQQAESRMRALICFRYALPLICGVLILLALCIPCLQYTNNQSGTDDPISGFQLMKNSWDQVRNYLFGTSNQTNGNILFSRSVLILLIGSWILFALSISASVWALVALLRYTERGTEEKRGRLWLITLIPNRTVLCLLSVLVLPAAAFPHIVIWLYRSIIYVAVDLNVLFVDPLWIGIPLVVATVILSCVTAPYERKLSMDPFRKPMKEREIEEEEFEEGEDTLIRDRHDVPRDRLAEQARREQTERIARLFLSENQNQSKENEHKD